MLTGDRVLYLVRLRNSDLVTANIQVGSTLGRGAHVDRQAAAGLPGRGRSDRPDHARRPSRPTTGRTRRNRSPSCGPTWTRSARTAGRSRTRNWPSGCGRSPRRSSTPTARSWPAPTSRCSPGTGRASASSASCKPKIVATCRDISALLGHSGMRRLPKLAPGRPRRRPSGRCTTRSPAAHARRGHRRSPSPTPPAAWKARSTRCCAARGSGSALQDLGAAVRYRSRLTDRAREIAILVVAHHWHSAFEIYAHEAVGAAAGLSAGELTLAARGAARRTGRRPSERTVAATAAALAGRGDLDDAEYAAAARSRRGAAVRPDHPGRLLRDVGPAAAGVRSLRRLTTAPIAGRSGAKLT